MTSHLRRKHLRASASPRPFGRIALGLIMLAMVSVVVPPHVFAQDQAAIEKLVQLNKKAMDDFDTADFDTAKKALLDAEKTGKRSGLEGHPVMARTYVHLGALYLIGFKDKQKASHYFGKAFDIQPEIRLDKSLTSSSVKDLFASVKAQKASASGAGAGSVEEELFPSSGKAKTGDKTSERTRDRAGGRAEVVPATTETAVRRSRSAEMESDPDLPADIIGLDCPYPDDTPPGKRVVLRCVAAPNLGVAGAALHFKGHQMADYERVEMTRSPKGWWQATVPKKRVDGKSLQFYFEGLDPSDKPVVSNGRAESPNVMLIVEKGQQAAGVPGEEDENPLEESNRTGPRFQLGKVDESLVGLDNRYGNRRFWIGLGAGTGFVYAIDGVPESRVKGTALPGMVGTFDTSKDIVITGFGWAGLGQLVPELGFHFNPDWAISIEGRHQWIPQTKRVADYTASGAHAVLLKVIRYTKQRRFRAFFAAAGGGGEGVRMTIQTDADVNPQLKDTVRVGRVLLGGSTGFTFEISRRFSWVAGLNVLYGFPLKGLAFDVNTGLQVNFGDTSGAAEAAAAKKVDSVSTSIDDEEPK